MIINHYRIRGWVIKTKVFKNLTKSCGKIILCEIY